jgi:hypothetical protein
MSQSLVVTMNADSTRTAPKQPAVRRPSPARRHGRPKSSGLGSRKDAREILVAVRSAVDDASLEHVCLILGRVPYAPSGTGVVRPGHTSSLIELPAEAAGTKAAVYFELALGAQRIPLVTDALFTFAPGAVCVITITAHTRAHSPPIEVEGAVTRLVRARELATGT